jgi:hypothetical protein
VSLIAWTGSPSTRVFQMFDAGKTSQPSAGTGAAAAEGRRQHGADSRTPMAAIRMQAMLKASARRCEHLDGAAAGGAD